MARGRYTTVRVMLLIPVVMISMHAFSDDIARFLEEQGLTELLTVHLEDVLESMPEREREEAVVRLADLYAELLETVTDPTYRAAIVERSRRLLRDAPERGGERLRLALMRGTYRAAERIAEQHRLRLADEDEVEGARQTFASLIPELQGLRADLRRRVEGLERRLGGASGTTSLVLAEELRATRELRARCTFLAAWALYYSAWLSDEPKSARVAQSLFGELLDLGTAGRLEDISVDRRALEPFARSILGVALCKSLDGATASAIRWVGLLNHPSTIESIRLQAPIWTMVIHLEGSEYIPVRDHLAQLDAENHEIPVPWLRIVAIQALEAAQRSRLSADLARQVMTRLATRGELDQIIDLAGRFGLEALGTSGFAFQYVSGVLHYHDARGSHGDEFPTTDAALIDGYADAVTALRKAIDEPDAIDYPQATGDALRVIAWSQYFMGSLLDARDAFLVAEQQAGPDDGPILLWMAIVSLDKAASTAKDAPRLRVQVNELIARFLSRYPHSEYAPRLQYRLAIAESSDAIATIERLRRIPENSEVYPAAQRRIADLLYGLFRAATGTKRIDYAGDYLAVAVPVFRPDRGQESTDGETWERYIVRGRRILEVALARGVEREGAARLVLDTFDHLSESRSSGLDAIADELAFRRLQERLLAGDVNMAVSMAGDLWQTSRDIWGRKAARAVFTVAFDAWNRAEVLADQDRWAATLIEQGRRVLEEYHADDAALQRPGVQSYFAAVAKAMSQHGIRHEDEALQREALVLYNRLLEVRPDATRYLRAAALLSQRFGDDETALSCWRRILAGTPELSDLWLQAKYNLILVLERTDRERAIEVMRQHRRLHPEYGAEPWKTRLRELDQNLEQPDAAAGENSNG